jgi:GcrA cell cycle regulator
MTWSDERVGLLKRLWKDGLSASQIADELGGLTRNAVIGKVHRLGLSGRVKRPSSSAPRARSGPRTPRTVARTGVIGSDNGAAAAQRRTLMQLDAAHCKWPVGDPCEQGFFFCGAPKDAADPSPYCPPHAERARAPGAAQRDRAPIRRRLEREGGVEPPHDAPPPHHARR